MPDYDAILQQQIEQAKRQMQQEMPGQMAGTSIRPDPSLGGLRAAGSGGWPVEAETSDYGAISYNPNVLQGQTQEHINNMLAHELTHVGQYQALPWYQRALNGLRQFMPQQFSYSQDPNELEAYGAAADRANRVGVSPPPQPSFYDASKMQVGDIWLPPDRKRTQ